MIKLYLTRGKLHAETMTAKVYADILGKSAPAIGRNPFGKPFFKDPGEGHLSLSHSGDYTLLALSRDPVGVDLQRLRMKADPDAAAARFFTPAEAGLITSADPAEKTSRFLALWAKKEAAVKAAGTGFLISPSSFSVLTDPIVLEGLTLRLMAAKAPAGYTAWLAAASENLRAAPPVIID
ncbi:MAG: 4'-phosphopantetheinyl transferase superfamily protein [Eubacteriaceae bacterium]|nr:4'-phosphopantetheinyl transferase superfamily protein [Eubacteriaceae bacterium]